MKWRSLRKRVVIAFLMFFAIISAQNWGPGLPQITFPEKDLFKHISTLKPLNWNAKVMGNNLVTMYKGYMFVIFAPDGGRPAGGFAFYDMSDPYNPIRLPPILPDTSRAEFVEAHGFGFSFSYPEDYGVFQSHKGIQFWDFTDVTNPALANNLILSSLPGGGYCCGVFSLFWQAPYVYTASSDYGIHIVDAGDPGNAKEIKHMPRLSTGDFLVGNVYAVGNLLMASRVGISKDARGFSLFDISVPEDPVLIFSSKAFPASYSMLLNGGKIYGSGNDGKLHVIDIKDWSNPKLENSSETFSQNHGEYVFIQDEFAFVGFDDLWQKVDLRTMKSVGKGVLTNGGQEGHPVPLGNFVMVGNDHGEGSGIFPHSVNPDTRGPKVNMVVPKDGDVNQALTSRIGLTFTDQITLKSVSKTTFIVREKGGAVLAGKYSGQQAILNFWPDKPLKEGTQYEVYVPKRGLTDWSGNPVESDFLSSFTTTGEPVSNNQSPKWAERGEQIYGNTRSDASWIYNVEGAKLPVDESLQSGIYFHKVEIDADGNRKTSTLLKK